jgi:hypothetical protein
VILLKPDETSDINSSLPHVDAPPKKRIAHETASLEDVNHINLIGDIELQNNYASQKDRPSP